MTIHYNFHFIVGISVICLHSSTMLITQKYSKMLLSSIIIAEKSYNSTPIRLIYNIFSLESTQSMSYIEVSIVSLHLRAIHYMKKIYSHKRNSIKNFSIISNV